MKFTKPFLILTLGIFLSPVASSPTRRFLAASPSAETDDGDVDVILDSIGQYVQTSLWYVLLIDLDESYNILSNSENETYNPVVKHTGEWEGNCVRFSYANNNEKQEGVIHLDEKLKIESYARETWEFNEEYDCVTVGGKEKNQIFKFVKHPDGSGSYAIVFQENYLRLSEENEFLVKNISQPLKLKFLHYISPSAETDEGEIDAIRDTLGKDVRTSLLYVVRVDSDQSYNALSKSESEAYNPVVKHAGYWERSNCVRFYYANNNEKQEGVIHLDEELKIESNATKSLWEFNEDHDCVTVGGNQKNQIFKFVKYADDSGDYAIVWDNFTLGLSEENGFLVKNNSNPLQCCPLLVG